MLLAVQFKSWKNDCSEVNEAMSTAEWNAMIKDLR